MSRGAGHATFVDQSRKMYALIEDNLQTLKIHDQEWEVISSEATKFLGRCEQKGTQPFDIIFFDPPYAADYETVLNYVGENAATLPSKFAKDVDRLVELARQYGRLDDPTVREGIALAYEGVEQMRCLGLRAVTRWLAGDDIGPESSMHKLYWTDWLQRTTELAMDIMGIDGITPAGDGLQGNAFPAAEAGTPNTTGAWVDYFLRSRAASIYAGSSEIQLNIISERILGLPRGPK